MDGVTASQAAAEYRAARKSGRRFVDEMNNRGQSGLLLVLEPLLEEVCSEIPLGSLEIPLSKIRGTYAAGRSSAFAGNFMPLLDEDTEFAKKWTSLYQSAAAEGIREPVTAYEYLGHYYILEGNKRVSVSHCLGAYSVYGEVRRLMPPLHEDSAEHRVFREFLQEDIRRPVGHLWFSEAGRLSELRELRKAAREKDRTLPENLIDDSFASFRAAYHKLGYQKSLADITTGDAFWQYVKIYGFPYGGEEEALTQNIRVALPQFRELIEAEPTQNLSEVSEGQGRPSFLQLFNRNARLSVLFVYAGNPATRFSAAVHDVGRYVLQRRFPELRVSVLDGLPTNGAVYPAIREAIQDRGHTLALITDATMGQAALRLSLEEKSSLVMHCHPKSIGLLSTYYAKTEETAFLLGVLAGSLSRTARIGFLRPTPALGCSEGDIQAFAQGAKLVRPTATLYFAVPDKKRGLSMQKILGQWGRMGIDMLWTPFFPGFYEQRQKSFPGVYAYLNGLNTGGALTEQYAASAWHWDAFYCSLLGSILEGSPDALSVKAGRLHYRLGLSGGTLKVHPVLPALGLRSERLLSQFSLLLSEERLKPVDEGMTVELIETIDE